VRVADWDTVSVEKFREIALNPRIDAARFAKPATVADQEK
jgi:hypothetical protein